jgi:hypothetical protein
MDFAQMLRELWRHKVLLVVGLLVATVVGVNTAYNVDLGSLSVKKKGLEFGAASTEILVDSKNSALGTVSSGNPQAEPFDALSRRADVYAQLLASPPLKRAIARHAGLPNIKIGARPPIDQGPDQQAATPSEQRANQLLNESTGQRLFLDRKQDVPVITVYGEAPSKKQAIKLVGGVAPALTRYIARLERLHPSAPQRQVRISQLGDPRGGTVNKGANRTAALLAFFGTLLVACIAILVGSSVHKDWRRAAAIERGEVAWYGAPDSGNGERWSRPAAVPDPERSHGSLELMRVRRGHRG